MHQMISVRLQRDSRQDLNISNTCLLFTSDPDGGLYNLGLFCCFETGLQVAQAGLDLVIG